MKKVFAFLLLCAATQAFAQSDSINAYAKKTYMIPMRDGVKLYTVVLSPAVPTGVFPVLLVRTPYGAEFDESYPLRDKYVANMAKEGYIFVFQDIRGKYKSEGKMEIHQPLVHATKPGAIDESTDTYDTVDWLTKNVGNNNGRVGILGISYPGWLALVGAVDPHPALKAASEQACMGDLFLGDDFHHNGAFRLSYGMEYTYEVEYDPTTDSDFPFPQYDLFDWYLKLGSLKNVNERYFKNKIPTWNNFVKHPNYDVFWQQNSPLNYMSKAQIPQLHVGGYYDQEDINGPQLMYAHMEKNDAENKNFIVLGPWNHGQWARSVADSLGMIAFGSNTAAWFQALQKKWFDYWLKDKGDGRFEEANCFQTGSNLWKAYDAWPPKQITKRKLFAAANGAAVLDATPNTKAIVSFMSDPAKPVPYRTQPIEATYGVGSRWRQWQVEDQRFVTSRPDVVSFVTDSLTAPLTVTGKIVAHLTASTTATDADWVVKLIDVYPAKDPVNIRMSNYHLPVAMEVMRGRYRKSLSNPTPLTPNKPEEFVIDLHDINHVFKKGHRLMIQIQSTWFPVIDRNPQKFVPNIFEAKETDFIKATHSIYLGKTYIELPIMQ
jgi:uncharacterized protein